jgi:hypothetical protein
MAIVTISLSTEGTPKTVSEIRKELARLLSRLNGASLMTYQFSARIENYVPGPSRPTATPFEYPAPSIHEGPLARPENE